MTELHIYSAVIWKIEMQQIIEMLAEINTNMNATQEKTDANTKTNRQEMKQEIRAGQKHTQEMIRTSQKKMKATL
jgi:hypothetical protein